MSSAPVISVLILLLAQVSGLHMNSIPRSMSVADGAIMDLYSALMSGGMFFICSGDMFARPWGNMLRHATSNPYSRGFASYRAYSSLGSLWNLSAILTRVLRVVLSKVLG